jgi:hypothetical protein
MSENEDLNQFRNTIKELVATNKVVVGGKTVHLQGKDPNTNLPYRNFGWYNGKIDVPLCDPQYIKKIINKIISEEEGLRCEYDETKCCWNIEYGTEPLEYSVRHDYKLKNIINHKKWVTYQVVDKALTMFPHLQNNYDDDELPTPPYLYPRWAKFNIYLGYNETENSIVIETNRTIGCNIMYYSIKNKLDEIFKDECLINWLKRKNYLMLMEGIEYNRKNPILRYLCDEYVARDICTYL